MFYCERCESKFNATVAAASGGCPRCRESEGITSPLRFRLFERSTLKDAALARARRGAAAVSTRPAN